MKSTHITILICLLLVVFSAQGQLKKPTAPVKKESTIINIRGVKMIKIPGKNLYFSATEITIGQYLKFCKSTGTHYPEWLKPNNKNNIYSGSEKDYLEVGMSESNLNYPITGVSWNDAIAFCKWLGVRLPTESEWEYAATGNKKYEYSGSNNLWDYGWFEANSGDGVHSVKTKKPNAFGLYDMSGNVSEWTATPDGSDRVIKGGSWMSLDDECLITYRDVYDPADCNWEIGFRVVCNS